MHLMYYAFWALGLWVTVKGNPPLPVKKSSNKCGVSSFALIGPSSTRYSFTRHWAEWSLWSPTQYPGSRCHITHQDNEPKQGLGNWCIHDQEASRGGRPCHMPWGDHLPGAIPPEVLSLVCIIDWPVAADGYGEPHEHVPWNNCPGLEGDGPVLLLHESLPGLWDDFLEQVAPRANLQLWQN